MNSNPDQYSDNADQNTEAHKSSVDLLGGPPNLDLSRPILGPVPASVIAAFQHAVYLSFRHEGKEETATFCPGRMFVNGSTNLLSVTKSREVLNQLFKRKIHFEVLVQPLSKPREVKICTIGDDVAVVIPEGKSDADSRLISKAETVVNRSVGWGVTLLFRGAMPTEIQLNNVSHSFHDHMEGWNKEVDEVHRKLFCGIENKDDESSDANKWFLVHMDGMLVPSNVPETYPPCVRSNIKGVIKEIHRPFGGIIDVGVKNGGLVKFHRTSLKLNGSNLCLTEVLEEHVSIGMNVSVDIVENKNEANKELLNHKSGNYVASVVTIGDTKDVEEHPEIQSHGQLAHRIRVVELYTDEKGRVNSGFGSIQFSQIIRSGEAAASMVGEWVNFKLEDLFFYGLRLKEGVDLGFILSIGDEINCQLKMLDTKVNGAQFVVKIGWLSKVPGNISGNLLPECVGLHKWCEKKGIDWAKMEKMVHGKIGCKADIVSGNLAVGVICDLEPAENNETVSKGHIKIEAGPHRGKQVRFNRSKASLFGQSLEKTDLLYAVRPYDQVFCEVSGIGDYPSGQYVSQKVHFHQPSDDKSDDNPMISMDIAERTDYLFWLSIHNNRPSDFKDILSGQSTPRYFIPFPRDPLPGRVVCFDPVRTNKYGCTSGTIVLEASTMNLDLEEVTEGDIGVKEMKDVKVTFHRACFWVYGRKMAKADLSYVVQPNQRVMVECKKITADDRKLHSSLPLDIDYRATVIWIGPSRPRNDREDPNRNDTGIFQWLSKRGLNINQFTKLVEGKLPPHSPHDLDHNNFYLPPIRGDGASQSTMDLISRTGQPEMMPVLRHGPVLAHILETAISSQGPADPRLFTLLENDDMAQAAHHVSEALRYAIQYYKEATANLRGVGFGMGYGPSGPPSTRGGHGKRPYEDYTNFGGGYSRPPSKQQRQGWGGY